MPALPLEEDGRATVPRRRGAGCEEAVAPDFLSRVARAYTQPPCPVVLVTACTTSRFSSVGQSDSLVMNRSSVRFRQAAPRITTGQAPFSPASGASPLPRLAVDAPWCPRPSGLPPTRLR